MRYICTQVTLTQTARPESLSAVVQSVLYYVDVDHICYLWFKCSLTSESIARSRIERLLALTYRDNCFVVVYHERKKKCQPAEPNW